MAEFTTAQVLESALVQGWVSEQVGRLVQPVAARVKPGTSVLLGYRFLDETPSGESWGWLRLLWPETANKARKHIVRAAKLGLASSLATAESADFKGVLVQHGSIATDPKLMNSLASSGALGVPDVKVLRYNPARRVVLRDGDRVVRILPDGKQPDWAVHSFVSDFVPVPPLGNSRWESMKSLTFVGDRDIAVGQTPQMARAAGKLFAELHAATAQLPAQLGGSLPRVNNSGYSQLLVHARLLSELDSSLADRCRRLAGRCGPVPGKSVLVHGDASPDQVIVGGSGLDARYWLTDFDRACLAPAAMDLGSYLATSPTAVHSAFLEGYEQAGGELAPAEHIRLGMAHALALRLMEPLRTANPAWKEGLDKNMTRLEELL